MKRLILIEPNLIKPYGHVIEFPLAIYRSLGNNTNIKLVANRSITSEAQAELEGLEILNLITLTCFENLENSGESFYNDLLKVDAKLNLQPGDIIVCLTSYTNQIYGAAKFIERTRKKIQLNLWFHQIFPPQKVFTSLLEDKLASKLIRNLELAIESISDLYPQIKLFTTESTLLNDFFAKAFKHTVGVLPLPYNEDQVSKIIYNASTNHFNLGFLGDGRYEKGGLLLMKAISYLSAERQQDFRKMDFYLQIINPRGYTDPELSEFNTLKSDLGKHTNVHFIDKGLGTADFYQLFHKLDILVLPYHPGSYDKRISSILLQALCMGIPTIVSTGTWLDDTIKKYTVGMHFEITSNQLQNSQQIAKQILDLIGNYQSVKTYSVLHSASFREINNPHNFYQQLQSHD